MERLPHLGGGWKEGAAGGWIGCDVAGLCVKPAVRAATVAAHWAQRAPQAAVGWATLYLTYKSYSRQGPLPNSCKGPMG